MKMDDPLVSHLGLKSDWISYLYDYDRAVRVLFKQIEQSETPDLISLPFLYLIRHTLELGFKTNVSILNKYSGLKDGLDQFDHIRKGHLLSILHKHFDIHFQEVAKEAGLNRQIKISYSNLNKKLTVLVDYFNKIDKGSFTFRYPFDSTGLRVFTSESKIDLRILFIHYEEAIILLLNTKDILDTYFNMLDSYEEEFNTTKTLFS